MTVDHYLSQIERVVEGWCSHRRPRTRTGDEAALMLLNLRCPMRSGPEV